MPIVGQHKTKRDVWTPTSIETVVVLTYERPGLLTKTIASIKAASPELYVVVYDDGSTSPEKLLELETVEESGIHVNREPHRGKVRTWLKITFDLSCCINNTMTESSGVVLLEDDLLFAPGWDETLLKMAGGVEDAGLKPGAMTCFRGHEEPQNLVRELREVRAYQTMQHGLQVNLVPAHVFNHQDVLMEAARLSEEGRHGLDVWFIGMLSHRLGLTSFCAEQSWVAHTGAGNSIAETNGSKPYSGIGYELSSELIRSVMDSVGDWIL